MGLAVGVGERCTFLQRRQASWTCALLAPDTRISTVNCAAKSSVLDIAGGNDDKSIQISDIKSSDRYELVMMMEELLITVCADYSEYKYGLVFRALLDSLS